MKRLLLSVTLFSTASVVWAQTKQTGNVVEYFGKEKIETVSEGVVKHHFKQGLTLQGASAAGTLFNGQDIIAWQYAKGDFVSPKDGQQLTGVYNDTSRKPLYKAIEADSTGVFQGRNLRGAYLYTSYHSDREQILLLDATGGTRTYVNGMPHEGDHYDFGYSLIPVKLHRGVNDFFYTSGRFARVRAKLIEPSKPVLLTLRDMTLPDVIIGEKDSKWAAIRLINATEKELRSMTITATLPTGETQTVATDNVMPLTVRKIKFKIPAAVNSVKGEVKMTVEVKDRAGKVIDQQVVPIQVRSSSEHHERTFISGIDGSVQYYSVAPSQGGSQGKALVLSVHGASVEARNQARAYKLKEGVTIVAATNRRPFGFNWEEWGRVDALEVLQEAKRVFATDPAKTYLTGHSMGGHGTWYLGTTYPDKFAAIAPCASYPDIITYGSGRGDKMHSGKQFFEPIARGANGGRVRKLIKNLKQSGVYVLHGDADSTVPVEQVREMRKLLAAFHPNFCYYEYPGGSHWYGDHSVDWFPIFEFFARQTIPANKDVRSIDFNTASPVISASDYWVKVEQQVKPYDFSQVVANIKEDKIDIKVKNVSLLTLDIPSLAMATDPKVVIGEQTIQIDRSKKAHLEFKNGGWSAIAAIDSTRKYAERQGGFKQAFDNNVVLVYATKGTKQENNWWAAKARFDAESFYYKGNGSLDVIADRDFTPEKYADRNVVIYGNAENNSAWAQLLKKSPVQVMRDRIVCADKTYQGADLGTYFVVARPDSKRALVGVVGGTGIQGAMATSPNNYISGITGFAEVMIFSADILNDGLDGVKWAGYFDNDWITPLAQ